TAAEAVLAPATPEGLAEAILGVLRDPGHGEAIGRNAVRLVATNYSAAAFADKARAFATAIESLVTEREYPGDGARPPQAVGPELRRRDRGRWHLRGVDRARSGPTRPRGRACGKGGLRRRDVGEQSQDRSWGAPLPSARRSPSGAGVHP